MGKYAKGTKVTSEKSILEIQNVLKRFGATGFMYGWKKHSAIIAFELFNRRIQFVVQFPDKNSDELRLTPKGWERTENQIEIEYEKAVKEKWRELSLLIKAKLVAVESGIRFFEDEFNGDVVLPNGQTVSQFMRPQIALAYENGTMPAMLPDLRD